MTISLAADGRTADIAGEVCGAPENLGGFDPLDGAVELIRTPRLRFSSKALPLAGGGTVASGGGLALAVTRPGAGPGFGRRIAATLTRPGADPVTLVTGAAGLVQAGGTTILPVRLDVYASNHGTGQATTDFYGVRDGAELRIGEGGEGYVLRAVLRTPAERVPQALAVSEFPPGRGDEDRRLIGTIRHVVTRSFAMTESAPFDYATPEGTILPWRLHAEVEEGGD